MLYADSKVKDIEVARKSSETGKGKYGNRRNKKNSRLKQMVRRLYKKKYRNKLLRELKERINDIYDAEI